MPDFDEPQPRSFPAAYAPLLWPAILEEALPIPKDCNTPIELVMARRRSCRQFGAIDRSQISDLLWLSASIRRSDEDGVLSAHGVAPSAGATNSVHILLLFADVGRLARYDRKRHSLIWLDVRHSSAASVLAAARCYLPSNDATVMLFAGELGIVEAKYTAPESLMWRDAGILQGHIGIAASSLSLAFCLLGATGGAWLRELLPEAIGLTGLGTALIGCDESVLD